MVEVRAEVAGSEAFLTRTFDFPMLAYCKDVPLALAEAERLGRV